MKWTLPAAALFAVAVLAAPEKPKLFLDDIGMDVPHVSTHKGVNLPGVPVNLTQWVRWRACAIPQARKH